MASNLSSPRSQFLLFFTLKAQPSVALASEELVEYKSKPEGGWRKDALLPEHSTHETFH